MESKGRAIIAVVITSVWALSFLASLVIHGYQPPPEINSVFMATVGATLVAVPSKKEDEEKVSRKHRRDSEEEDQPR